MSPQVMDLSHGSRLLFIGLITQADDLGRGSADIRKLKAAIFGGDNVTTDDVRKWLDEIADQSLATLYFADEHGYLYALPSWKRHQSIDRPRDSGYPAPTDSSIVRRMLDEPSSRPRATLRGEGRKEGSLGRKEGGRDSALPPEDQKAEEDPPRASPARLAAVLVDNATASAYFDKIKATYPANSHRSDWLNAQAAAFRLIDSGRADWETLLQAVERYRAFCDQGGVGGPQYVLTATRFFGDRSEPWAEKWLPPAPKPSRAQERTKRNLDAVEEARAELFGKKEKTA